MSTPTKHAIEAALTKAAIDAIDAATADLQAKCASLATQLAEQKCATAFANEACERLEAKCAAMKWALEECRAALSGQPCKCSGGFVCMVHLAWTATEKALASDAGRAFVPIADVKPLLEALRMWEADVPADVFEAKHGDKLK